MCGIAGVFTKDPEAANEIVAMTGTLCHRGPDANETFTTTNQKVSFGHTRLSIIDLSVQANQPMQSSDGRFAIVFNGEIYNYRSLKAELQNLNPAYRFQTNSDTEVILCGYHHWGSDVCNRLEGMFAFAIYDQNKNELFLCRDRMGKKPLYYFVDREQFIFASEIKSILKNPRAKASVTLNRQALTTFLHLGYIPEPHSAYDQIRKFPAGHYATISGTMAMQNTAYWKITDHAVTPAALSVVEAKAKLKTILFRAVEKRLISDVPLGAFLSGGTDSSLVTAIAAKLKADPLKTFAIGFEEEKFNELQFASSVATHLKTEHHEYVLRETEAFALLEQYINHFDEPFADTSAIPTMLVSRLARKEVAVALTGDGGDELFLGYGAYDWAERLNSNIVKLFQEPIASTLYHLGDNRMKRASYVFRKPASSDQLRSHIFSQEQYLFSQRELNDRLLSDAARSPAFLYQDPAMVDMDAATKQSLFDLQYYLKDDLLVKVDRASMFYGLECRCPLLDHDVVELAMRLHPDFKRRNGERKWILKELLKEHIPENLIYREKKGFSVPLAKWMKSELLFLIEKYLDKGMIDRIGFVNYEYVHELKRAFFGGRDYYYNRLWVLIILHKWLDENA